MQKKNKKYRLINSVTNINYVTIKDTNLLFIIDEFSKEFAGRAIGSYLDFYSRYNQLPLIEKSRDLTAIIIDLGLL